MWKNNPSKQMNLLRKTQENLEETQKNNVMFSSLLESLVLSNEKTLKEVSCLKTEEEKLKAAYALNLCTVSISQIIDFNDLQFMEKEYDAILNNLNIEEMPKDEALLHILKQILDVITFFKLQDGDKKLMEKEYQKKIKDAIWSAVPNPTMILAAGHPAAIAVTLATQVGIGYMNYRKEKSKVSLEKERSDWELQRSAMEQFHGLRRELFDTAWRLADEYNFPDEYRITERQITQYNDILLDSDDLRRYERLEYIKDRFRAYPPFWYHLGSAATSISLEERFPATIKSEYKNRALDHFKYFLKITENNLMREDQLVAACALEMFELIDGDGCKEKQLALLDKAKKASGNAFDVLQICAISYLKLGETKNAIGLLKMLVNENYNTTMNAQLLSRLYVSEVIEGNESYRDQYILLANRFDKVEHLFPLPIVIPKTDEEKERLAEEFIYLQKKNIQDTYASAIKTYISNCESRYDEICKGREDITSQIANFIKDMSVAVRTLVDEDASTNFLVNIKAEMPNEFKDMLRAEDKRVKVYDKVSFKKIFGKAFVTLGEKIVDRICSITDMSEVSRMESYLYNFVSMTGISMENYEYMVDGASDIYSIEQLFGPEFEKKFKMNKKTSKFIGRMNDKSFDQDALVINSKKMEFLIRGKNGFDPYYQRNKDDTLSEIAKDSIVAILNDRHATDTDLIFTTEKIYVAGWKKIKSSSPYKDVTVDKKNNIVINKHSYGYKDVNMSKLYDLIKLFAEVANEFMSETDNSLAAEIRDYILTAKINKNIEMH